MTRKLSAPWRVVENAESYRIETADGLGLAYLYFEDDASRRALMNLLTKDEARRVAANIARLPDLLRDAMEDRKPSR